MQDLIKRLNEATKAYDEGNPIMSDAEWDRLYFELKVLEEKTGIIYPDSPTQTINYEVVNKLSKVKHSHKMLSLEKTKNVDEVEAFLGNNDYVVMAKLDGLTCSLTYENGELVLAETRGNGVVGEDVTHNAKVISSIPQKISYKETLIVDGEIICFESDFVDFSQDYKNPRNFAAGSIRLLDAKECAGRKLSFIAWDMIKGYDEEDLFTNRLNLLQNLGFQTVPWIKENPIYAIADMKDYCQHNNYPIDGVVFKFESVKFGKSLGETSHHFKNAIAYKFADDEYETVLRDIEWSMGRTGILTPVAIFDPVDMDGSLVSRANLHNINILTDILGEPYVGQKIWIIKSNMIIPQVIRSEIVKEHNSTIPFIAKCPCCGEPTSIIESDSGTKELYCSNPLCSGKLINRLDHYLGKKGLDAKGISEATLEKLIEWGWVSNIEDIYSLYLFKDEWKKKPGFGEKSVNNILESINNSKTTTLTKFITAIGIPLIGNAMAKTLSNYFKTWEAFREAVKTGFDFSKLDDFGLITSEAILNFDYTEADKLYLYLNLEIEDVPVSNKLEGKKIAITGTLHNFKNRSELQAVIEQAGGKVVSSVTKNTSILINNDTASASSKNITAKKLNIPIITEEQFMTDYID